MLEVITMALNLAVIVGQIIQTEEALKYVREMKDIQDQYSQEHAKPVGIRDDAKMETLRESFKNSMAAFQNQVAIFQANKTGAPTAAAPVAK